MMIISLVSAGTGAMWLSHLPLAGQQIQNASLKEPGKNHPLQMMFRVKCSTLKWEAEEGKGQYQVLTARQSSDAK